MPTITFDTLAYTRTLREAGFTEAQAEALAQANGKALTQMLENRELATKGDITRLDGKLDVGLADVKALIAQTAAKQTKDFHNALFGFAAAIAAFIAIAVAILK